MRYQLQQFSGHKLIRDHGNSKAFAYGPQFDYSQAPAQRHRAAYTDADAASLVQWLNERTPTPPAVMKAAKSRRSVILHNYPTRKRNREVTWYMCAGSGPLAFIFLHSIISRRIVKTPADGWTEQDAYAFHRYLMGWENSGPENLP